MANITFEAHEVEHRSLAQIGTTGLYYVLGFAVVGMSLVIGMNFVLSSAIKGLVLVLGGGA